MKAIIIISALFLVILAGCSGGYRQNSYAISQNEAPVVEKKSLSTVHYK